MIKALTYIKSRLNQTIILICLLIVALGYVGVVAWNSPIEEVAEEVLKAETGIEIKPNN